jgi:hypothetical protein
MMEQGHMQDGQEVLGQDEQALKALQDVLLPLLQEAPPAVPAQQHLEVAQDDQVPPLDGVEENPAPVFQPQQQPGWSRF